MARTKKRRKSSWRKRLKAFHKRLYRQWTGTRQGMWLGLAGLFGLLGLLGLASCLSGDKPTEDLLVAERLANAPRIRVALHRGPGSVEVAVEGRFQLESGDGQLLWADEDMAPHTVTVAEGAVVLGQLREPHLVIRPLEESALVVNQVPYRGVLHLEATEDGLLAVNELDIEGYVLGVLGNEMPLSWPESSLMAQAVAARSYAIYQLRMKPDAAYHVAADTSSQVYKGRARETEMAVRVVRNTAGVVVTYDYRLFCTYYHSTCGGHTVGAKQVFGISDITPLSGVPCTYCSASKYYRWEGTLSPEQIRTGLQKAGLGAAEVARVETLDRSPTGHVKEVVVFRNGATEVRLPANRFRLMVGASLLRSTAFDLMAHGGQYQIRGRGWGHGVGMCQWGARGLGLEGRSAEEILHHYYPGSELHRLY